MEDKQNYKKEVLEVSLNRNYDSTIFQLKNGSNDEVPKDNGIIEVGVDRIRIHHSNSNYKKEMEDSSCDLRKKPKKKISCGPFRPEQLPGHIVQELRVAGKLHDEFATAFKATDPVS